VSHRGNGNDMHPLRSLIGLEKVEPPYPTSLIQRCETALDLPLERQTPETLRLLIGQQIGLPVLVPIALDLLERYVLVSGDMYEGDLLAACLKIPQEYWTAEPEAWVRLNGILESFDSTVKTINEHRAGFLTNNPFGARL
jgi:hypothetical protein